MVTQERRYEVITACRELMKSSNITDFGKLKAKKVLEEMYKELSFFGGEKKWRPPKINPTKVGGV